MDEQTEAGPGSLTPSLLESVHGRLLCRGTVICVGVLPDFYNAVAALAYPSAAQSQVYLCFWLIVRAIQVSTPVLLIVYLSGLGWDSIGLQPLRWLWDPMWAIGIWAITTYCSLMICSQMPDSWFANDGLAEDASAPWLLLIVAAALANGFAEELVIRGYLLSQLEKLLNSTWQAVLIPTLLFTSYHVYQGIGGTIDVAIYGILMSVAFCTLRRIWPLVLAHAFSNIIGFLAV